MRKYKEAIDRRTAFHNGEMQNEILLTLSMPSTSSDYYGRKEERDNSWIERDCSGEPKRSRKNIT